MWFMLPFPFPTCSKLSHHDRVKQWPTIVKFASSSTSVHSTTTSSATANLSRLILLPLVFSLEKIGGARRGGEPRECVWDWHLDTTSTTICCSRLQGGLRWCIVQLRSWHKITYHLHIWWSKLIFEFFLRAKQIIAVIIFPSLSTLSLSPVCMYILLRKGQGWFCCWL